MPRPSDRASAEASPILPAVARGEPDAVRRCIETFGGLVWALARRQGVDPSEAEDVVQEIFVELWKHAGRYDPALASERTFVATIARRRLIDAHRRRARVPPAVPADETPLADRAADPSQSTEVRRILASMDALRDEQRRILRLALGEGWSHAEIAAHLEMPLGTVKSHARRGLRRLQELLGEGDA